RIGAELVDEAAADLIATESAPEVIAATRAGAADFIPTESPRSRWMTPRALMGVVAAALVIGLLSVGRILWIDGVLGPQRTAPAMEVVQPGISDRYAPVTDGREAMAPARRPVVAERRPVREFPEYIPPSDRRQDGVARQGSGSSVDRFDDDGRRRDAFGMGDMAESLEGVDHEMPPSVVARVDDAPGVDQPRSVEERPSADRPASERPAVELRESDRHAAVDRGEVQARPVERP